MSRDRKTTRLFSRASRIWFGSDRAVNATRLFRRTFLVRDTNLLESAELHIFADAVYHLWVNGTYLGRGPTFFHPHRRPIRHYDVHGWLRRGRNVIAVLVHSPGISMHNYIPCACPGLVARLDICAGAKRRTILSDSSWKATDRTGWKRNSPRRSWAIGFIEHFEAENCPWGWAEPGYDDIGWLNALAREPFRSDHRGVFIDPGVPGLRYEFVPSCRLEGVYAASGSCGRLALLKELPCDAFGNALMKEKWRRLRLGPKALSHNSTTGGFVLGNLSASSHTALCFDLGAQHTGSVVFDMECDTPGTVDIAWSETMQRGRPRVLLKGNTYADRYEAVAGRNRWLPIGFSSGRYLLLVLRGFKGRVCFRRFGMLASEPDLPWNGFFRCGDRSLNSVAALCVRTLRVGIQEGQMDCPTREQAAYVADGNLTAQWMARLTGNFSHWRHLLKETFAAQSRQGLVKTTIFSGITNVLLDYELLSVVFARDYLRETRDLDTIRKILPGCRALLAWFEAFQEHDGFFPYDWESREMPAAPGRRKGFYGRSIRWTRNPSNAVTPLKNPSLNVFIDHPGMGWHNTGEPGIDRRGTNTAMNALLVIAYRALAELAERCGCRDSSSFGKKADTLAASCSEFWDDTGKVFVDGIRNGRKLHQISQQTNVWCMMASLLDPDRSRQLMRRILREDDRSVAQSGPYFYSYMLPLMHRLGLHREALNLIKRKWSGMIEGGATTLWETFAGDELDSWCHPWSAAPLDFMLRCVAGIGSFPSGSDMITIKPRPDLLKEVSACVMTDRGRIEVEWKTTGKTAIVHGKLPPGVRAEVYFRDGRKVSCSGSWKARVGMET